jgi:steroid delta-isomerase-like uncharacterized protein
MKTYYSFFLLVLFLIGCSDIESLLKTFGETWNSHDIETMVSLFTSDCIYEEVVSGDIYEGKDGVATYAKEVFLEIPDFNIEVLSVYFTDKWAMSEWIMRGSYSVDDSISGEPPDIKTFATKGASIIEFKDDKIFKVRDYWASSF